MNSDIIERLKCRKSLSLHSSEPLSLLLVHYTGMVLHPLLKSPPNQGDAACSYACLPAAHFNHSVAASLPLIAWTWSGNMGEMLPVAGGTVQNVCRV